MADAVQFCVCVVDQRVNKVKQCTPVFSIEAACPAGWLHGGWCGASTAIDRGSSSPGGIRKRKSSEARPYWAASKAACTLDTQEV